MSLYPGEQLSVEVGGMENGVGWTFVDDALAWNGSQVRFSEGHQWGAPSAQLSMAASSVAPSWLPILP